MPRATTKTELLTGAKDNFNKMRKLIDSIPGGAQSAVLDFADNPKLKEAHWSRDKNLRDVLVHLYEWHELLLNWAVPNKNGASKPFLPEPYTWKTYGDMNAAFWNKHQSTSYEQAVEMLNASHKKVLSMIETFSDEELFTKKYYPWTGTSSLGSYCISAAVSHYDWAIKKIKRYIKELSNG